MVEPVAGLVVWLQRIQHLAPMQHRAGGQAAHVGDVEVVLHESVAYVLLRCGCLPDHFERVLAIQKFAYVWPVGAEGFPFLLSTLGFDAMEPQPKVHDHVSRLQILLQRKYGR